VHSAGLSFSSSDRKPDQLLHPSAAGGMMPSIAMLLHCTKRPAVKFPHDHCRNPHSTVSRDARTQLGEWHGHLLLMDGRQSVLFCHDLTCYRLFLSGLRADHFADLGPWHQELFLATLAALIRSSFLTHPGFVMVSTWRMEQWKDENDRTQLRKSPAIRVPKRVADGEGSRRRMWWRSWYEADARRTAASAASLSTGRPVEMYQAPQCPGGSRFS
jgi:hypothetical protein